jgi:formylglycine-generating enzyme required for sulfatase activity
MRSALPAAYDCSLGETWESRLAELERAWRERPAGGPLPRWLDYLPPAGVACPAQFVFWLVATDVECRAGAGLPALLAEPYFDDERVRQAGVTTDIELLASLVRWEYRLRWRNGERVSRDDYLRRFPDLHGQLEDVTPVLACASCGHDQVPLADESATGADCPACGAWVAVPPRPVPVSTGPPEPAGGATPPVTAVEALPTSAEAGVRGTKDGSAPRRLGRYEVGAVLAEGGMGRVLCARDPELGRDLAVKVIKPEYRGHAELVRRFENEARITAQLQHPGIVPVHDTGRDDNGLPFLVMKLVRGRTLEELLAERASPGDALTRFMGIFEQVCQAVGFAHEHRVIHRDLKPLNVMVGRFGEVQVMDWGLAKVLPARETAPPGDAPSQSEVAIPRGPGDGPQTQGALGTPSYMPPEQAGGDWERVDERADVFGLGGILCTILTGRPPYEGRRRDDVWRKALRGDLEETFARLEACGADAELVGLARQCLCAEPVGRPRDAAEVARRVAEYQSGVQERLRRAESDRVAAEARALEAQATARAERRARRRAVALTMAVLTLVGVVAGGGVVGWLVYGRLQAQALRDRLLDARTADAQPIVVELAGYRRWAEPLLRQARDEAEASRNDRARLHASVGLLPWDSTQADYVYGRLLDAEAADVMDLVQALEPYRDRLTARLWEQLRQPQPGHEGRVLRAACALAVYDPDNPAWPAAAESLVGRLVAENPVFLGDWIKGLAPVRGQLQERLVEVFRDRRALRQEERTLATNVLAEWAADRPEVLADLLMDADPKQFATLWPRFIAHGDAAGEPMRKELDKQAVFDWQDAPLKASWDKAGEPVVRRIEAAAGWVDERFAFCQALPLAELEQTPQDLRAAGYRPTRVRPYGCGDGVRVAVVWTRDGGEWRLSRGLGAAALAKEKDEKAREGFVAADLAGYLDGSQERYAALWRRGDAAEDVRLCFGLTLKEHDRACQPLQEAKLQPRALQSFVGRDGEVRYSSVWSLGDPVVRYVPDMDEASYLNGSFDHGLPVDVSLTTKDAPVRRADRHYAGRFAGDGRYEHACVQGVAPAEHLGRCRELARQGYRPVAIGAAASSWPQTISKSSGKPIESGLIAASIWHRPVVADEAKQRLARRQANAAVVRFRLGHEDAVWPLLRHEPDPRRRSLVIHRLSPLGADVGPIVRRLGEESDVSARRALLLCLGEFGPRQYPPGQREALVGRLARLYEEDPDAGVHAAAEWVLRRWGEQRRLGEIDAKLSRRDLRARGAGESPAEGRRWYVNGQGQTMVVMDAREPFLMGSPRWDEERFGGPAAPDERQHWRLIGRKFALASKPVTAAQFLKFRGTHVYNTGMSPTGEHPVNTVTWYEVAGYCNWLSEQEGIPPAEWCYEQNPQKKYGEGMGVRPGFLRKSGYRLPTEAEWEFACRAGAITGRYHGQTEELLGEYAWYSRDTSMLPVGTLKPNDLGLFDMLGNVEQWCQTIAIPYPPLGPRPFVVDEEGTGEVRDHPNRIVRGGCFSLPGPLVRCAYRNSFSAATYFNQVGFRVARTQR